MSSGAIPGGRGGGALIGGIPGGGPGGGPGGIIPEGRFGGGPGGGPGGIKPGGRGLKYVKQQECFIGRESKKLTKIFLACDSQLQRFVCQ